MLLSEPAQRELQLQPGLWSRCLNFRVRLQIFGSGSSTVWSKKQKKNMELFVQLA